MNAVASTVRLTFAEIQHAWFVAGLRATAALKWKVYGRDGRPYRGRYGSDVFDPAVEVAGAIGELAAAKAFGLYWGNIIEPDDDDVGGRINVRAANKRPFGLCIHPTDANDKPFLCADLSALPCVTLPGWAFAKEAKNKDWWKDPTGKNRHAFFMPVELLHSLDELAEWIARP